MIPSITVAEITQGLYGAWRLFVRDPIGLQFFDDDVPAFWKSFWCAIVVLPGYVLLRAFSPDQPAPETGLLATVMIVGLIYVIGWVVWPLIMGHLIPVLEREDHYVRYVVAYNWSAGPQILLYVVVLLISLTGVLPTGFMIALNLATLAYLLAYHYFIIKVALDLHGMTAAFLVVSEFIVGLILRWIETDLLLP